MCLQNENPSLATVTEDGKPWARYVAPSADADLTVKVATFLDSRKVAQIRNHPEVHLTLGVTDMESAESYLQVQGRAEIHTGIESKKENWNDHLKEFFSGPDDPNYAVIHIVPYRIEFQGMGMKPAEVWESR